MNKSWNTHRINDLPCPFAKEACNTVRVEYSIGFDLHEAVGASLRNLSHETWELFGSLSECFSMGKNRAWLCHGIFLPFFCSPPSSVLLHFLLCIIDRGNADSWVWVTGNLVSWWRNKPGGVASILLCQFLPHALLLAYIQADCKGTRPTQTSPVRSLSLVIWLGTGSL